MQGRSAWHRPAKAVIVAGVLASTLALAFGPASATPSPTSSAGGPPGVPAEVLPPVSGEIPASPVPDDASLVASLASALTVGPLGADVTASVVDAATGAVIFSRGAERPQQPASTLKIFTGVTVLRAMGDDTRLTTRVVTGKKPGTIVLSGGGDATLTRLPTDPTDLPAGLGARTSSLTELATLTAQSLRARRLTNVTLLIDDSEFTGPSLAPSWPNAYLYSGFVSRVSALSADGGRVSAGSPWRDADPALAAGQFFAQRLIAEGIVVQGQVARVDGSKAAGASQISSVQSPTIADMVERMLTLSDNDLAEALAHIAGGKLGGEASFAGGVRAVERTLLALGVSTSGVTVADGSGLSALNRVTSDSLAHILAITAFDAPAVGATVGELWPVASGLPIAGVTGTLAPRFVGLGTSVGRGIVRAKTGTLRGVDCLAGLVRDRYGRLLAFAFVADRAPGPVLAARNALDRAASLLI
ncbi:unannotated protein [freshwater metagenome]|uniref:Unannotated protein n=1 Tax=freshwater metagenome TaxID=449393 RepID=A0A6J7S2Z4_9ZZZZ